MPPPTAPTRSQKGRTRQEASPDPLREYRRTNRELVEAQRALAMVTGR